MKTYKQGDTIRFGVKLAHIGTGAPVNLEGCTAYSQMRRYPGGELIAEGTPSIDIALGKVSVEFPIDLTARIEPGIYGCDIRLKSVWKVTGADIDVYHTSDPVGFSGRDVFTLYTTQLRIVSPYTEME